MSIQSIFPIKLLQCQIFFYFDFLRLIKIKMEKYIFFVRKQFLVEKITVFFLWLSFAQDEWSLFIATCFIKKNTFFFTLNLHIFHSINPLRVWTCASAAQIGLHAFSIIFYFQYNIKSMPYNIYLLVVLHTF